MREQGKLVHVDNASGITPVKLRDTSPPVADIFEERLLTGASRDLRRRGAVAFGQALRSMRAELGLTQETLALRCRFDRTYLSLLEGGRRTPTFTMIVKLSQALKVDPVRLFAHALDNYLAEPDQ